MERPIKKIQLLTETKTVIGDGIGLDISATSFNALLCLARHRDDKNSGGYVSNVNMRLEAWGSTVNSKRVVDVAVCNIRKVLGKSAIISVINKGCKLSKEMEVEIINSATISIGKTEARTDVPYQHVSKKILFIKIVDKVSVGGKMMFLAVDKGAYMAIEPDAINTKWMPYEQKPLENWKQGLGIN